MPVPKIPPHLFKEAQEAFKKKFTPGFYHSSANPDIQAFDPYAKPNDWIASTQTKPRGAIFVGRNPKFTESLIGKEVNPENKIQDFKTGATTYPVSVNLGKHFDYLTPEGLATIEEYKKLNPKAKLSEFLERGSWDAIEQPEFLDFLKNKGFDTFATQEVGFRNVGVFDPKNIRGKFAEYNPEHAESADFMKAQGGLVHLAKGGDAFKEMVKAYKLFRTKPNDPETLYPLFVNANKPVPIGEWLQAEVGPLSASGKVKSKLGELAYRPGWHAGDLPIATHIGDYNPDQLLARKPIDEIRKQMILERNATTKAQRAQINKEFPYPEWATKPTIRPEEQVWAEINMPADVDWQKIAEERTLFTKAGKPRAGTAHITDQIPFGGHYRYKTNPNMLGNWLISGDMRVNRVLPNEEVSEINRAAGLADLPRLEEYLNSIKNKAEGGLAHMAAGGKTPAWQRKEGQNPEGGLNAKGRASYHAETGGTLKRPQPEGGARRDSFCARMKGAKEKLTSAETARDPDSRINKALRKWNC